MKVKMKVEWIWFWKKIGAIKEKVRMPRFEIPEWVGLSTTIVVAIVGVFGGGYLLLGKEYEVELTDRFKSIAYEKSMNYTYDRYTDSVIKDLTIDGERTLFGEDIRVLVMWRDNTRYRYHDFKLSRELNRPMEGTKWEK